MWSFANRTRELNVPVHLSVLDQTQNSQLLGIFHISRNRWYLRRCVPVSVIPEQNGAPQEGMLLASVNLPTPCSSLDPSAAEQSSNRVWIWQKTSVLDIRSRTYLSNKALKC